MQRYELPEGWEWRRLGDLCEIAIGKTPKRSNPRYWGGNNLWATVADLNNGVVTETKEHITDAAVSEECRNRLVRAGTLLMSFKLSIGKMAFAGRDLYTNEASAALPIRDETVVDKKYLFWCLKVVTLDTEADEAVKGKTLNKEKLKRLQIPLPPLAEQRRIVARIEEITRRVEEARDLQREALDAANTLLPAAIAEVMDHADAEGWEWKRLKSLGNLKNGGTPSKAIARYWDGGNVPFVTAADLTAIYVSMGRKFLTEEGLTSGKTAICGAGDILIGTRTRVGNCSIAAARLGASQDVTRLRLTDPEADVRYICLYLRHVSEIVAFYSQGSSIQGITRKLLNSLEIALPPLAEQRRIIAYLDGFRAKAEKLKREQEATQTELDKVIPSVLSKAFRGEL